jgi:predicted transglutaminase-like cysteine proteinase
MRKGFFLRLAGLATAGLVTAAIANAADAQHAVALQTVSYVSSKTTAILGGTSALSRIMAAQGVVNLPAVVARPAALAPASQSAAVTERFPQPVRTNWSGRPDVFGSVAVRVDHTSLDNRWRSIENATVAGTAAEFARSLRSVDPVERARQVNAYVNAHVTFADDYRRFHRADVWSTANETLRAGRGDCEDYAIAKRAMLIAAGLSPRDLYLVLVKDLVRRADHAILVVRAGGRTMLLDNGADQLLDPAEVHDYRPIITFASGSEWTHGYLHQDHPVKMAQAENVATIAPAADQRSLKASLLAFNTGLSR